MRVRFTDKDPRRGTIADLDQRAAQGLIDSGNAVEVKGRAATTEADRALEESGAAATSTDTGGKPAPAPRKRAAPAKAAKKAGRGSER